MIPVLVPRRQLEFRMARLVPFNGTQVIVCDDDGVAFVGADRVEDVLSTARAIWEIERRQAERIRTGETLRAQTRFADYLARRSSDSTYTFRAHLRAVRGAIEQ